MVPERGDAHPGRQPGPGLSGQASGVRVGRPADDLESWRRYNPYLRYPALALGNLTVLLLAPVAVAMAPVPGQLGNGGPARGRPAQPGQLRARPEHSRGRGGGRHQPEMRRRLLAAGIDAVRRVSEAFESQPGLLDVKSLTHSVRPVRRGLSLEMVPMVSRQPGSGRARAIAPVRARESPGPERHGLARHPADDPAEHVRPGSLDPARQAAFAAEIEAILEPFREEGLEFDLSWAFR
jgi:hypothetical protein